MGRKVRGRKKGGKKEKKEERKKEKVIVFLCCAFFPLSLLFPLKHTLCFVVFCRLPAKVSEQTPAEGHIEREKSARGREKENTRH